MKTFKGLLFAIVAIFPVLFASCTTDDEKRVEAAKIVESRSSQDLMNDLYLACDGDIESLARMLQVTPSSINRIRNGETEPTFDFEEKIKSVAIFYFQNDRKFSKLQSILDPEYGWYDSILNFPSHHPWLFWGGNAIMIFLSFFAGFFGLFPISAFFGFITIGEFLLGVIAWIAGMICSPDTMEDKYTDTINPVIELLI